MKNRSKRFRFQLLPDYIAKEPTAMIDIEQLRKYYEEGRVFSTQHAAERFRQRGIRAADVRLAVGNGEIIEQYPGDFPFPSCLILGADHNKMPLHVCMSDEGSAGRIITAYRPDPNKWSQDLRTRKETSDEVSDL